MIARVALSIVALSFLIFIPSLHGKESDTEYYPNRPGRRGHGKLPPGLNGGGPPGSNRGGPPVSVTTYNGYVGSERSCRTNEFRCNSGECLSSELKCNKVTDCDDGSDEADCSRPSCSTSGCILPPQPKGGKYEKYLSKDNCTRKDENKAPINSILVYYCHDRHVLRGYASSTCIDNKWTELPTCVGICPPLESTTVDISCTYEEKSVSCSQRVKPGTRAKLSCKQSHKLPLNSDPVYREIVCLEDATWNHLLYECIATCGQVQHYTSHTVFPWYVGVYERKSKNNIQHVCGGSLISSNLVISAAHCFYIEGFLKVQDPSRYNVTAGKYHRSWEVEEIYAQKKSVERIFVTDSYIGNIGHHVGDIAILKLVTPFELTFFIRPVCVDWDNALEKKQLINGQVGKVTGWGEQKDGMYNKNLREFNVPYISFNQCSMNASIASITFDKFCAGGLNGSSLCFGHSGSGLFFETGGIWYIRGIVSVSTQQHEYCDSNSYVGFTYVSHYREWIKSIFESQ